MDFYTNVHYILIIVTKKAFQFHIFHVNSKLIKGNNSKNFVGGTL